MSVAVVAAGATIANTGSAAWESGGAMPLAGEDFVAPDAPMGSAESDEGLAEACDVIPRLSAQFNAFLRSNDAGGEPARQALDDLADTLIVLHPLLEGSELDEFADRVRRDIGAVDALPQGNGPEAQLDRISWTSTAAILHDRLVEHCNAPARSRAQQRRNDFLG